MQNQSISKSIFTWLNWSKSCICAQPQGASLKTSWAWTSRSLAACTSTTREKEGDGWILRGEMFRYMYMWERTTSERGMRDVLMLLECFLFLNKSGLWGLIFNLKMPCPQKCYVTPQFYMLINADLSHTWVQTVWMTGGHSLQGRGCGCKAGTGQGAVQSAVPPPDPLSRELPPGAGPSGRPRPPAPCHKKPQNQRWNNRGQRIFEGTHDEMNAWREPSVWSAWYSGWLVE